MVDLLQQIREIVGEPNVLVGDAARARTTGWRREGPCAARAVVRPGSPAEVSAVLRLCHAAGQPVVPQGGMTGLVEGAVPASDEVALSLERLRAIEELDEVGRTMTVEAGVPLQAIQERAAAADLMFPLDLGARGSCTIGGNLATNAGGNHVIRYGMARDLVLGVEAVLADGTVVSSMNRMIKNNAGYDLKHLFLGTEGTLGVITRAVLRLRERPRSQLAALLAVPGFPPVTRLLRRLEATLGGTLSAFEVMWEEFYRLVTTPPARGRAPLPHGAPYYVLIEALGSDPGADAERLERALASCAQEDLVGDAVLARTAAERDALWSLRDDVEQLFQLAPVRIFDVSLALVHMEEYVGAVRAGLAAAFARPRSVIFGHLGDGNLHLAIGVGRDDADTRRRVEEAVYAPLRAIGGSVSAEHGIGMQKRRYLSWCRSPAEIALMRRLKQALDPSGILNPGRVLPPEQ